MHGDAGLSPIDWSTAYHSGQTEDLRFFLEALCVRQSPERIYAVGFSLGANVLLKYLAESPDSPVSHAVAVSPPLDLAACAQRLKKGASQFYQSYLLRGLHQMLAEKRLRTDLDALLRIDDSSVAKLRTIEAYDDAITAPLHGFGTKERYYRECSSGPRLAEISAPTTILSSIDDPFLDPTQYDRLPSLPKNVELRLTRYGGHVGFIQSLRPGKGLVSWLDGQILTYFISREKRHVILVFGEEWSVALKSLPVIFERGIEFIDAFANKPSCAPVIGEHFFSGAEKWKNQT